MVLPKPEVIEVIEGIELAGPMIPADEVGVDWMFSLENWAYYIYWLG